MYARTLIRKTAQLATPLVMLAAIATPAYAYVGPGAGVSLFGAAIGLVVAIFSALGVIMLWPIRALVKKLKRPAIRTQSEQAN